MKSIYRPQAEITVSGKDLSAANEWLLAQTQGLTGIKFYVSWMCIHEPSIKEDLRLQHLSSLEFVSTPYPAIRWTSPENQGIAFLRYDLSYRIEWHWRPDNGQKIFTMGVVTCG